MLLTKITIETKINETKVEISQNSTNKSTKAIRKIRTER